MSKSIRVSDELAELAEASAAESHRSPPQQIEHWAQIGRVLEPALSYTAESAVKKVGRSDLDGLLNRVGSNESKLRTQEIIRSTSGKIASSDDSPAS